MASTTGLTREQSLRCVGSGWANIICEIWDAIDASKSEVEVAQVKEKFGTLRFYAFSDDENLINFIEDTEGKSDKICEQCGERGKLRTDAWWKTLCDTCK